MSFQLHSAAFASGDPIPVAYTGDGQDLSPPLEWSDAPPGTRELALIVEDPDAPGPEPWVHWLLYGVPPTLLSIPEGIPPIRSLPQLLGSLQGLNSWKRIGYRGPSPPPGHGRHRYRFYLYALQAALHLEPGLDKATLHKAMEEHVLARAELQGIYARG